MAIRRVEPQEERPEPIGPPSPTNFGAIGWLLFWTAIAIIAGVAAKAHFGY